MLKILPNNLGLKICSKYLLAARSAVEASHDSYTLLEYDMHLKLKSHVQKEQQMSMLWVV